MLMRSRDLLRSPETEANSQSPEATADPDGPWVVSSRMKLAFFFAKRANSISAPVSISVRPIQRFPDESTNWPLGSKKSAGCSEPTPFNAPRKRSRKTKGIVVGGCALGIVAAGLFAISRMASAFAPLASSNLAASEAGRRNIPTKICSVPICRWPSLAASSAAKFSSSFDSVVKGISTEVGMRSPRFTTFSTSARICVPKSMGPKHRCISAASSRRSPRRMCSVSMAGLPYSLAS